MSEGAGNAPGEIRSRGAGVATRIVLAAPCDTRRGGRGVCVSIIALNSTLKPLCQPHNRGFLNFQKSAKKKLLQDLISGSTPSRVHTPRDLCGVLKAIPRWGDSSSAGSLGLESAGARHVGSGRPSPCIAAQRGR